MIRQLSDEDLVRLFGLDGVVIDRAWAQYVDGRIEAAGGFVRHDGRLWVFTQNYKPLSAPMAFVRALRRGLHMAGETVHAQESRTPQSARLLKVLCFEKTPEIYKGASVYTWQHSQHCSRRSHRRSGPPAQPPQQPDQL